MQTNYTVLCNVTKMFCTAKTMKSISGIDTIPAAIKKWLFPVSYFDLFFKSCIVLDEITVHNWNNFYQEWMLFFYWAFSNTPWGVNLSSENKSFSQKSLSKCLIDRIFLCGLDQNFDFDRTSLCGDTLDDHVWPCPKIQERLVSQADEELWICRSYPFRHKNTPPCAGCKAQKLGSWTLQHME